MPLVDLIEVSNKQFTFAANRTICNAYNIMRSVCGHSAELGSVRPLAGVRRICFGVEFLVELIEVSNGQFTCAANRTICDAYNIMRSVCGHAAELGSVGPLAGTRLTPGWGPSDPLLNSL